MLREFQYNPSSDQIAGVLKRFNLDSTSETSGLDILKFELLSPDSFVWKLLLGNVVYYLYAEDYISGIEYVKDVITDYVGNVKWDFVTAKEIQDFDSSSPVESAEVYKKPERADDLMKYAVSSGYDFVFLVKTLENPDEARFPSRQKL